MWSYRDKNKVKTSVEAREERELFQSKGFNDWLNEKCSKKKGEHVSNCCCAKVYSESDVCSKCKEHCETIYI